MHKLFIVRSTLCPVLPQGSACSAWKQGSLSGPPFQRALFNERKKKLGPSGTQPHIQDSLTIDKRFLDG